MKKIVDKLTFEKGFRQIYTVKATEEKIQIQDDKNSPQ